MSKMVERRIERFKKRYRGIYNNDAHFIFACHAAFPLVLTDELLYLMYQNFAVYEKGGKIPFSKMVVADVIHSPFCSSVGPGTYEMESEYRRVLLDSLRQDERFGDERVKKLASFLLQFAERRNLSETERDLKDSHIWTALAELSPEESKLKIQQAFVEAAEKRDKAEVLRISFLLDSLAEDYGDLKEIHNVSKAYRDDIYGNRPKERYPVVSDKKEGALMPVDLPDSVKKNLEVKDPEDREQKTPPTTVYIIPTDAYSWEIYRAEMADWVEKLPGIDITFAEKKDYRQIKAYIVDNQPELVVLLGDNPPQLIQPSDEEQVQGEGGEQEQVMMEMAQVFSPTMLDLSELFPLNDCKTKCALFLYPGSQIQAIDTMWRVEYTIGVNSTELDTYSNFLYDFLQEYGREKVMKKVFSLVTKEKYETVRLNFKKEKWLQEIPVDEGEGEVESLDGQERIETKTIELHSHSQMPVIQNDI